MEGASHLHLAALISQQMILFLTKDLKTLSWNLSDLCEGDMWWCLLPPPPIGYIQASRALMIASIVFGTFGIVATLAGMQCSKVGGENYLLKGRIATVGGAFFLLQGNGVGVGWSDQTKLVWQTSTNPNPERWVRCCPPACVHKLSHFKRIFMQTNVQACFFIRHGILALGCHRRRRSSDVALCCRYLHHDRRVLVRSQHHAAVLWRVLPWDKVSLHKSGATPRRLPTPPVSSNITMPQVRDRRGLVHWLVLSHAGHLRRIVPDVRVQSQHAQRKKVGVAETLLTGHHGNQRSNLTGLLCSRPYPYQPSSRGRVLTATPTSFSIPSNYGRNAYVWQTHGWVTFAMFYYCKCNTKG